MSLTEFEKHLIEALTLRKERFLAEVKEIEERLGAIFDREKPEPEPAPAPKPDPPKPAPAKAKTTPKAEKAADKPTGASEPKA